MTGGVETDVAEVFRDAGVRGWLHAVPASADSARAGARHVDVGADEPVVMASVYKLVLLVAFCRAVDDGRCEPRQRLELGPSTRTAGPTGVSALADPVTLSLRDLASSMITVSDNAAADVVLDHVGLPAVHAVIRDLGLSATRIERGTAETLRDLMADTGTDTVAAAFRALTNNDATHAVRALDAAYSSATSPRDMTTLLGALWRDEVASTDMSAFARQLLRQQVWPHRLRAGFPPAARVAGKTGTLGAVRNEVGVVEYPGEHPIAVAVFTHAARADSAAPRADAAVAAAARLAVRAVRAGPPS